MSVGFVLVLASCHETGLGYVSAACDDWLQTGPTDVAAQLYVIQTGWLQKFPA